jgi:hypothetical protein
VVERSAQFLGRGTVLASLLIAVAVNAVLFIPAQRGVVPADATIEGMPTVVHLQMAWTPDRFRGYLEEWSGSVCSPVPDTTARCVWSGEVAADGTITRTPPPVADGPAGFRRMTMRLDYSFPVLYGLLAVGLTSRLWGLTGRNRRWLPLAAGAGLAAVLCDMAENTLHLWLLRGVDTWDQLAAADFPAPLVAAASAFATGKYAILAILVTAALLHGLGRGWRRLQWGVRLAVRAGG